MNRLYYPIALIVMLCVAFGGNAQGELSPPPSLDYNSDGPDFDGDITSDILWRW